MINTKVIKLLLLVFFLTPDFLLGQKLDIHYNEKLLLRDDSTKSNSYLLGDPTQVRTDSRNNIYVSDEAILSIRIFDESGNLIKNIGARGRGPGEFLHINTFCINKSGNLLVLDAWGGYKRTIFSIPSGEILDEGKLDPKKILWPKRIIQSSKDNYLLMFILPRIGRNQSDNIFHFFSEDLKTVEGSFGSFSALNFKDPFAIEKLKTFVGSMESIGNNKILFVPQIYKGKIYEYTLKNKSGFISDTLKGVKFKDKPFISYDYKPTSDVPYSHITANGIEYWGSVRTINAGLYELENGNIIHFTAVYNEKSERENPQNAWNIYAELFNKDYELLGYDLVKRMEKIYNNSISNVIINWKDEDDNFYLINEGDNKRPVIRKFSLDIRKKN